MPTLKISTIKVSGIQTHKYRNGLLTDLVFSFVCEALPYHSLKVPNIDIEMVKAFGHMVTVIIISL